MDSPARANAAQMAARSIKAKPRSRLGSQKSGFAPVQNSNNNNAAAPSGGGLFGGSISGSSSFNFAAPAGTPTPTFSPSFGDSGSNPFAQSAASANEDPRADTTGEEAARRGKGFRAAGEDEEALFAAHSPYHHNQPSSTFGSSDNAQPQNSFGATNATLSNGGGFQFGSSTSQNQSGNSSFGVNFNFTATPTSRETNNNSNTPFAFGSTSQATANNSTPTFTFGGTNSGQAENSSSFGAANSQPIAQNSPAIENSKASYFNSDPTSSSSCFPDSSNFFSQTTFSTNQFDHQFNDQFDNQFDNQFNHQFNNSTLDPQLFHTNENTGTMFGNYKVEYPPDAGQAPAQNPQNQVPLGSFGTDDMRYFGGAMERPTSSIFGNNLMFTTADTNMDYVQDKSNTAFGQNNATDSFGAQNNALGSSFGGSFGNQANTSFAALSSSQSMFGSTTAATPAPSSSSIFTSSFPATTSAPSTSNLFGNVASSFPATSAPNTSNIFGSVNSSFPPPAAASSTPLFGAAKPAESTPSASSTPLFGVAKPVESAPASSTPLFGALKPAESTPASRTPLFGAPKAAESTSSGSETSNMFAKSFAAPAKSAPDFSFGKQADSTPNLFNPNNQNNGQSSIFGSKPATDIKDKQTLDLFNVNKPVDQPSKSNATEEAPAKTPSALFQSFGKANPPGQFQSNGVAKEQSVSYTHSPSSGNISTNSWKFASPLNHQAGSSFKIRGSAEAHGFTKTTPPDTALSPASSTFGSFSSQAQDAQASNGQPYNGTSSGALAPSAPTNSSSQLSGPIDRTVATSDDLSHIQFRMSEPTQAEMDAVVPRQFDAKRKREFFALFRITSVQRAMAAYFHHLPPGADPSKGLAWMEAKKKAILSEYKIDYISGKRSKSESEDEDQESASPQKRTRYNKEASHRVSSPEKRHSRHAQSPEKQTRAISESESQLNGNSVLKAPKPQPGRSSSPSKSSSRPAAPEPTSSKKRKPETYLTQDDPEGLEDGKSSNKRTVNSSSSSTSNIFKNILDSAENPSGSVTPERKTRALPGGAKEATSVSREASLSNPFGTLPGASPIKPSATATSTTPGKPPTFKMTSTSTTPTTSPTKPPTFTGAPTGGIKPPVFSGAPVGGIKPPSFGSGPANFMDQFGKKAAESAEDNEKKLMQKAKDEDFDSEDDDEAEWEANYKKKRAAELKELAELAKGKAPTFLVKSTEIAKSELKETAKPAATNTFAPVANTASKPLFGQAKPVTGAAESIFSSANASRTSTPNLFSGTGSVLDSAASASGKTPSFVGNPFAHLSDADSNNQNDGDDESSNDGTDGEDENKDPSYKPNTSNGTTSTPTTPIDKAATGISKKTAATEPPKPNSFGSATSSGATTPIPGSGGSLLSRMSRDPVPEEKDGMTPKSTTNMFGSSFGATSGTSTDKTWKPDTPIKFGSAAPSGPTFNFTGTTPTKPLGGLFGNSGSSTPALGGATTTTGFQFGGTASATSSLFPSVAASADTSRATTPGVTTDGATDADDNDPEKVHAQVNLLESNRGEEHENVLHSVRVRALKFIPKEEGDGKSSSWETKGVGPLKVLCDKETKATRIVLRSDPSGSIILNKSLLSKIKYEASGKTVKLMTLDDDGKNLQTWVLQLKEAALAEKLAKCLEDNKVNNN